MAFALLCPVLVLAALACCWSIRVRTGISPVATTARVAAAMFAPIPPETRGVIYELEYYPTRLVRFDGSGSVFRAGAVRTAGDAYGTKIYLYRMPPVAAAP